MELESEFRAWLKSHLKQKGCEVTNIESSTKNGIPDMFIQQVDFNCWVECKIGSYSTPPLIRKEQRVWLMKNHKAGGNGLLISYDTKFHTVDIYHPEIKLVEPSGKLLKVLDEPIHHIHKLKTFDHIKSFSMP